MSPAKNPAPPADATAARERHADIADLPYEAARDELVAIVGRLEGGQVGLEESMRLWERGEALADHCAAWLDGAQQRLTRSAGVAEPAETDQPRDDEPTVRDDEPDETDA